MLIKSKFGSLKVHYSLVLVAFSRASRNASAHPHPAFCRHLCVAVSATPLPRRSFRVPNLRGPPRDAGRDIIPGILPIVRPH